MTSKQILFNPFLKQNYSPEERSLQGWIVIFGFLLICLACYVGPTASLRLIYPIAAFVTAIFLYLRHPILYLGFTWWMWFLSALFTRLVDLQVGWDFTRQMLVAPYLVVFVSIATLFRYLPSAYRQGGLPFILAFAGVFYGFLIGLVHNQPVPVARSLLDWLTPLLFGFHLFINWRDYPSYRQNIQRTFLWCVLILGVYGIYQFVVAPEWDRYWLVKSLQTSSSGNPEPFGMRVWSTMHSIGPFGATMQAGLLLLFTRSGPLIFPASAAGYLSFLLAQTRTNWGGWLFGMIMIMGSVKARIQMRLITIILVMIVCVAPLLTIEPISSVVSKRVETFVNLQEDGSFRDRSSSYDRNLSVALSNTLGNGFGNTWKVNEKTGQIEVFVIDSGILDMFFTLGWFGAIPYLGGLILIIYQVFKYTESRFDSFLSAARAIGFTAFAQLIIGSGMLSIAGMILWGFLAMAMAAHKYYQHQGITTPNQSQGMTVINQRSIT
ncbi:O-antigen ligase domain-containing protein [Hassallia byssoidea VB512170]|uniref:O-antigen ligase domain-containing protein n=1 Tax=Hassallia byssoidea VB512170 TaxID=1304833 RepID=A0A846H116_9CYAN|nr:O-antigen ligase domain-containing protein [Hassalia byssoidea VB512170]